MNPLLSITRKEFAGLFATPVAYLFLALFLATTLFLFFWVETFFARNIADLRPLFEWMPLLLLFLSAALTMRLWSAERRQGTLELLLTAPPPLWHFVLGKFLAALALVALALLLTLPLPLLLSQLATLDWGPVLGGYFAALSLAAGYLAIGLYISARSDNPIVALLLTTLIGLLLYLLGSNTLTALLGYQWAETLKLLSPSSRFAAITRGVIDLRDLYYYASLSAIFLLLNLYTLERQRWDCHRPTRQQRRWQLTIAMLVASLLLPNFLLHPYHQARLDLTQGRIHSISEATHSVLEQLQEPLLIRGYFSDQTHPLLAPLIPRLRDLLEEYAIAGQGAVRIEWIDPLKHPELEREAGQRYGIQPVAFQTASRHQAALVNAYFDIVIQYGENYQRLNFRDLVEVKTRSESDLHVELRNPEYDLTRAIRRLLQAHRLEENIFDNLPDPITFRGYISPDHRLPEVLQQVRQWLDGLLAQLELEAAGRLQIEILDPDAGNAQLAQQIRQQHGFRPMALGLQDPQTFWFYLTLESNGRTLPIALPEGISEAALEQTLRTALKHLAQGVLKSVALHSPDPIAKISPSGELELSGKRYTWLEESLAADHHLIQATLHDPAPLEESELLLLIAPSELAPHQLFAIDQFLMRGGSLLLATSPFDIDSSDQLRAQPHRSGLEEWLAHHGIELQPELVFDPHSAALPITIERNLNGHTVRETRQIDYPLFVDIRPPGINRDSGLTASIEQVTLTWASPIQLDPERNQQRTVTPLLHASPASWSSPDLTIQPDFVNHPLGFPPHQQRAPQLLAVAIEGRFDSLFRDRPLPTPPESLVSATALPSLIEHSPETARILLFASNTFLEDAVLDLISSGLGSRYLQPLQLIANSVDWSLEDRDLLPIRGRSHFSRTLPPLTREQQLGWEALSYALTLCGLLLVGIIHRVYRVRLRKSRKAKFAV